MIRSQDIKHSFRRKKIYIEQREKPPNTRRFCLKCGGWKTFIFNPIIGHSECGECGFSWVLGSPEWARELKPGWEDKYKVWKEKQKKYALGETQVFNNEGERI